MDDHRTAFIEAATWHGGLERAEAILAANPEIATSDIHTAAILGDDVAVRRFIERDSANVTATSEPYGGDALTHLCLSKYLRLDPARSGAFLRAATALLDAGANPNGGFWNKGEFETALYGAAGVAHHPALTQLLLDRGADPNDEEVAYHSPETDDNAVIERLVQTGKITADNLALMLVRKHDWHDGDGAKYLLEHGADPNRRAGGRFPSAIQQAIRRDNDLEIVDLLLDHGADPTRVDDGRSAVALAARRGRGDVLASMARRGVPLAFEGVDRLIAACAMDDDAAVQSISSREPGLVRELVAEGGALLAQFAGTANTKGAGHLLDLGVDVAAVYEDGDGYFGVAPNSTALHVAAWRAWHETVRFLIERGAPIDALDGNGRTPLALAVRACVDSYWAYRRSPESVDALLRAGASVRGVAFPSGYADVDELLRRYGATP